MTGVLLPPAAPAEPTPSAEGGAAAAAYLASLAEGSRRTQTRALDTIAELASAGRLRAATFPWHTLTPAHVALLRAGLSDLYAPATARRHLAALRGVLRAAWRNGALDSAELARALDVPGVRGSAPPRGRELSHGEVRALFDAAGAEPGPAAARDGALLALLYGGGLRRAEAAGLTWDDHEPTSGAWRVKGKGSKVRLVYLPTGGAAALDAWRRQLAATTGPVLRRVRLGGAVEPGGLSSPAIWWRVRHLAALAGVAPFSPHDLRRTYVGHLLAAGADLAVVQRLCGHESPTTTARYDRRPEEAKRRAADLLAVPYSAG